MPRPVPGTYLDYYNTYISLVKESDIYQAFDAQQPLMETFFSSISEEKSAYAYAEGKWTIKEVLQHMIDTERVFAYRAMCIARGETKPLPGFDENEYASKSLANRRSWKSLREEFQSLRKCTRILFDSLSDDMIMTEGNANNHTLSVLAAGFIIVGHTYHHVKVIRERYEMLNAEC